MEIPHSTVFSSEFIRKVGTAGESRIVNYQGNQSVDHMNAFKFLVLSVLWFGKVCSLQVQVTSVTKIGTQNFSCMEPLVNQISAVFLSRKISSACEFFLDKS
jgi:hypothetical protein